MVRALLVVSLSSLALSGCGRHPLASRGAQVVIDVTGTDGRPFRPDRVYWYYPPNEGSAEEFDGGCLNRGCTRWVVHGATEGTVYVAAWYLRPSMDPYCSYHAYDARPAQVREGATQRLTLRMEVHLGCE